MVHIYTDSTSSGCLNAKTWLGGLSDGVWADDKYHTLGTTMEFKKGYKAMG